LGFLSLLPLNQDMELALLLLPGLKDFLKFLHAFLESLVDLCHFVFSVLFDSNGAAHNFLVQSLFSFGLFLISYFLYLFYQVLELLLLLFPIQLEELFFSSLSFLLCSTSSFTSSSILFFSPL